MAVRSGRRLRRMAHVPDSESDDDGSLPNVQPIHLSDDEDNATSPPRVHVPQQAPGPRFVTAMLLAFVHICHHGLKFLKLRARFLCMYGITYR